LEVRTRHLPLGAAMLRSHDAGMSTVVEKVTAERAVRIAPLRIGDVVVEPPILQAPMAGFTNFAFRQIVREYGGAGLQATEMINAKGFAWLDQNEAEHPDRLWGVGDEPRPLAVQIWDNDPATLALVGSRLVEEYQVSVVDINFGCPVKQVTEKAHSGSYLLRYPQKVGEIVERVVRACEPTPVTAKIRLGCTRDSVNAIEVAKVVEASGAAALTVHGRTAQDFFKGSADWDRISEIKSHLNRIPLIGNGDLDSAEKVVEAFRRYHVDGVMIARASLGRPWLFQQAAAALRGDPIPTEPSLAEQRDCMLRHYDLVVERFGIKKGTMLMRKFACCYAQGKHGARHFRTHVAKVSTPEEFYEVVRHYFPQ
jgi:tRNA-dihydrouridine synthase B